VAKAVPADSALVEVSKFFLVDFVTRKYQGPHYAAWVILSHDGRDKPGQKGGHVRLIDLGKAETIDKAVDVARSAIRDAPRAVAAAGEVESERTVQGPLQALARLVLHPLLPHVAAKRNWIISPDASLWLVPWAALPLADGRYAIEDHGIRYVVSGRDLLDGAGPKLEPSAPVMFADPNFDLGLADAAVETRRVLRREIVASGLRAPAESLGSVRWAALPGTAAEAEAIGPKLAAYTGRKPYVYTENFALEGVLKAFARPRLAVLSTHGFFLSDHAAANAGTADDRGENGASPNRIGRRIENPLLRCGLVLAGANHKSTDPNLEDGVLTGLEIVGLDLRGTELVVLSACETGLGEVRNGEGVAGLRQAFQLAGAQAVVATLWQIPDRDSALLMIDFFDQLAKGRGKVEALREAQLARIKARREHSGAAHPLFWAAFTLTGK
jgi:CHAT domain-containing protein